MAKKVCFIIILALFSISFFVRQQKNAKFASWIERTCKPFDKGKLTALPLFCFCQYNLLNVSYNMLKYKELPEVNSSRWLSLENFEGEVWKDIPEYEGFYKISNYGRLMSIGRSYRHLGGYRNIKNKICKLFVDKKTGYYKYTLCKNKTYRIVSIHRVVASIFIPNPQNLPFVNHKDEIKTNNQADNLEWCTPKYNTEYSNVAEKVKEKLYKKVVQYDFDGNLINSYKTTGDAARSIGVNSYSSIARCCKGEIGSAYGYVWRYENEEIVNAKKPRFRCVVKKDLNNNIICEYKSIKEAALKNKVSASSIIRVCKGHIANCGGFIWSYKH